MKKIILLFILSILLLLIIGCNNNQTITDSEKDEPINTSELSESNISTESNEKQESTTTSTSPSESVKQQPATGTEIAVEYSDISFEEALPQVTDVIIGRFKKMRTQNDNSALGKTYFYEFVVEQNLRGNGTDSTTIVVVSDPSFVFPSFFEDQKYLLLLRRHGKSVTNDEEVLFFASNFYIPLYDNVTPIYGWAKWKDKDLKDSIKDQTVKNAFNNGTFIDYIVEQVKDNPLIIEHPYIESTDINDIINGSDVLKVHINNLSVTSYDGTRETFSCNLLEALKGKQYTSSQISIAFEAGDVKVGQDYIVAVEAAENAGDSFFVVSSKNSVFELSEENNIKAIINNDNAAE